MSISTPDWVKDAVFYQIFPDRFARSAHQDSRLHLQAWGAPPTFNAYMGGDLWGVIEHLDHIQSLGYFGARTLNNAMNEVSGTGHVDALDTAAFAERMGEVARMYHPEIVQAQLNLLGSHDTARFLSAVGGDASAMRLATTFQLTYSGAPCIYYGDEIGLPGGPDPDCRRAMPWDESAWDRKTMHLIQKLTAARHASPALRRGSFDVLHVAGEALAYRREYEGDCAYVLMNTGLVGTVVNLAGLQAGRYCDVLSGQVISVTQEQAFSVPERSAVVLVRQD